MYNSICDNIRYFMNYNVEDDDDNDDDKDNMFSPEKNSDQASKLCVL